MGNELDDKGENYPRCPCCGRMEVGLPHQSPEKVSVCASTTGMAPLGFAVPFFFRFIKICIQSLVFIFLVYSIYKMYLQGSDRYCNYEKVTVFQVICGQPWIFFLSDGNINPNRGLDWIERGLFISSFGVLVLMRIFYQYRFRKLDQKLDKDNIDITDYTVMVFNLPTTTQEGKLEEFFKTNFRHPDTGKFLDIQVGMINFLYHDFEDTLEKGDQLKKKLDDYRKKFDNQDAYKAEELKESFMKELELLELHLHRFYDKENLESEIKQRFTGVALVTLEHEEHADIIKSHYVLTGFAKTIYHLLGYIPKPILNCLSDKVKHEFQPNCFIFLDNPLPPEDIIWRNFGKGRFNNLTRKIFSFFLTILILSVTLGILLLLKIWQLSLGAAFWVQILFTSLIKVINAAAMYFNTRFIDFEKITSFTDLNAEIVWRSTLVTCS